MEEYLARVKQQSSKTCHGTHIVGMRVANGRRPVSVDTCEQMTVFGLPAKRADPTNVATIFWKLALTIKMATQQTRLSRKTNLDVQTWIYPKNQPSSWLQTAVRTNYALRDYSIEQLYN